MQLRPYQQEAVAAIYRHLREHDDNPCAVIPTAGGKTPVMATVCKDAVGQWRGRVLIVAHVKELLQQAVEKLRIVAPELLLQVGVYSAGLNSRDTQQPIIVAGVQSVYKRAANLGRFDLVIIDEAHMIPPDGDGMYRTLLAGLRQANPQVRVIGLTATPFRMTTGSICAPDSILNAVCYEIGVRELIVQGYLCPLKSKASREKANTSALHVRAGEFIANEAEALMDADGLVEAACREITEQTRERKSCLVFTTGVKHGRHVAETLERMGQRVATVFGDTFEFQRDATLRAFKAGEVKFLVNVNVLTTGFDAPSIDCVALLRPTMSPGLYYQMVGRGFRLCAGKKDCLVLDFGGNVVRHGPVDQVQAQAVSSGSGEAPAKECPDCHSVITAGYAKCPDCGHEFPPPERQKHEGKASNAGVLSGEVSTEERAVQDTLYSVHVKRGAPPEHPKTLRVDYQVRFNQFISEWVCPEHTGFARWKFEKWWRARSDAALPTTAEEAAALAHEGALAKATSITCRHVSGEKHEQIIGHVLGPKPRLPGWDEEPASVGTAATPGASDDDIPF